DKSPRRGVADTAGLPDGVVGGCWKAGTPAMPRPCWNTPAAQAGRWDPRPAAPGGRRVQRVPARRPGAGPPGAHQAPPRRAHRAALATVRDLAQFLVGNQDWALADMPDIEAFLATLSKGHHAAPHNARAVVPLPAVVKHGRPESMI